MPEMHRFAAPSADPGSVVRGGEDVREALGAIAREARIIGVGEAAHSVAEIQAVQELVVGALLEPDGGSEAGAEADGPMAVIALESGFAEALALDAWVGGEGGDEDLAAVAERGMTYGFGASRMVRRLLARLRERNRREPGGRVRVVGLDLPGSATSPGPAVRVCLDAVPALPGDAGLLRRSDLGGRTEAAIAYERLSADERSALARDLRVLVGRVRDAAAAARGESPGPDVADGRPRSAGLPPQPDLAIALRAAESLAAFLDELEYDADGEASDAPYPRERFMAETALWAAARYGRTVVLAHNAHVRREPLHGRPTLGGIVAEELGGAYRAIATSYASGPAVRFVARSPRPFDCDVLLEHREPAPGSIEAAIEAYLGDTSPGAVLIELPSDHWSGARCALPSSGRRRTVWGSAAERDPRPGIAAALAAASGMHAGAELDPVDDLAAAFDAIIHLSRAHRVPGAFERLRTEFGTGEPGERSGREARADSGPETPVEADAVDTGQATPPRSEPAVDAEEKPS